MYENIVSDDEWVYINTEGGKIKIAKKIGLKKLIRNINTDEEKAILVYKRRNCEKEREVNRDDYLNTNSIIKLQKFGVDVMQTNAKYIVLHLRNEEEKVEIELQHSNLGFLEYEGRKIYNHYNSIGINSTYCGQYEIKPKGSRDEWLDMFKTEVLGNTNLEFVCCVALSSVIVAYIGESMGLDTIIFHKVGNSTSGKSTGTKLAISMFGYPDVKKNGLFSTYNATDNALIKQLTGIKGMPVAFDELSMSNTKNLSSFVYKLANGTDKSRLNQDSTMKEKEAWLGTVISNGEKSLIDSCNKNAGIQNRIIEARNISWTRDAENAENINSTIIDNYGHIGVEFAKFVMEIGEEGIKSKYKNCVEYLMKVMESKNVTDNYTKRRINKYASIYLAGKLFQNMLDVEIDMKGIVKLMLKIEKESIIERNFDLTSIEIIKMYVDINRKKFISNGNIPNGEVWGKLTDKDDYVELEINPIKFESIVKEAGFEDKNVVLKELKNKGLLLCDKDRFTRKRKDRDGIRQSVIVIKLNKD